MPVTEVPALTDDHDLKDLRLALVCYGGVSLAIYIHGVTKEIHKLVVASKAFEHDPETNPFSEDQVEHVYWEVLDERRRRDGYRTRVVVDIIAGTSAGGINGIILAKALARNLSQDALRDLWLTKGDIKKLLAMPRAPGVPLRVAAWMVKSVFAGAKAPLNGPLMYEWVKQALEDMDATAGERPPPGAASLLPEGHPLELKVPITDFYGLERSVPTYDPKRVTNVWHRHVMRFRQANGTRQLEPDYNERLAFAARATSCFPVAFPPVSVRDLGAGWAGSETFDADFFPHYRLAGKKVEDTYFIDGGVLDNFPFKVAFDAIRQQAASVEVDRRLIYIQPDPGGPAPSAPGTSPGLRTLFWGGISGIPRKEPIVEDLLFIRDFNERVGRVNAMIERSMPQVAKLLPAELEPDEFAEAKGTVIETAAKELGLSHDAYTRLKLYAVVERFAGLANDVCQFPGDSNHAFFVKDVLAEWASTRDILDEPLPPAEFPSKRQVDFLRTFDLRYAERRIRFAIRTLNSLYDEADQPGRPSRKALNELKRDLYEHLRELSLVFAGDTLDQLAKDVRELFDPQRVTDAMASPGSPDDSVREFVAAHGDAIDRMESALAKLLQEKLAGFSEKVYASLWHATEKWGDEDRRKLLASYLGFPVWDVLVFPIQEVGEVGELNRIEVIRMSPQEEGLLPRPEGAPLLEGIAIMHFGAFFKRRWRENDYLWGRLDGAARLIRMLLGEEPSPHAARAFRTILTEEQPVLGEIPDVFEWVERKIDEGAREATPVG